MISAQGVGLFAANPPQSQRTDPSAGFPLLSLTHDANGSEQPQTNPEPTANVTTWLFDADTFRPAAKIVNGHTYSILCDYLGTPAATLRRAGHKSVGRHLGYLRPLRNFTRQQSRLPFRYPGQYEDVETGLYYNRFHYYDCESGVYISQDPIRLAGGKELYGYVRDVNVGVDVLGLSPLVPGMPLANGTKLFRIGGHDINNLLLKSTEMKLDPPGISMIRADNAEEAGNTMKRAFPKATNLHNSIDAGNISEILAEHIRAAGFDVIHNPSGNIGEPHARLIHPKGAAGFSQENLSTLSNRFNCK